MLYTVDTAKNFRALVLTPPGCEPGEATTVASVLPYTSDPMPPAVGRRGYLEAIAAFQSSSALTDVVAFDVRDVKQVRLGLPEGFALDMKVPKAGPQCRQSCSSTLIQPTREDKTET
jgi:hypothetical protein